MTGGEPITTWKSYSTPCVTGSSHLRYATSVSSSGWGLISSICCKENHHMQPPDIQTMLKDLARCRTTLEDLAQQYEAQRLAILAAVQPALDAAWQAYCDQQAPLLQAA